MPKEVAFDTREFFQMPDGSEVPAGDLQADLDLHNKGYEVMRRGAVVRWTRDQMLVELGVAKLEVSTHRESEPHYMALDRNGINRLIRSLRKARDQAFGADA